MSVFLWARYPCRLRPEDLSFGFGGVPFSLSHSLSLSLSLFLFFFSLSLSLALALSLCLCLSLRRRSCSRHGPVPIAENQRIRLDELTLGFSGMEEGRAQPRSGCPTFVKMTWRVCCKHSSTLERERARAHPVGESNYRGTSLIKEHPLLGPYRSLMPWVLGG